MYLVGEDNEGGGPFWFQWGKYFMLGTCFGCTYAFLIRTNMLLAIFAILGANLVWQGFV